MSCIDKHVGVCLLLADIRVYCFAYYWEANKAQPKKVYSGEIRVGRDVVFVMRGYVVFG